MKAILRKERNDYGKAIRKRYEKGEIKEMRKTMSRYEPRPDGLSNTDRIIDAGILDIPTWHNLAKRVLDPEGICTCIHTMGGGISSQRL